eukprot:276277-Chlamydomonas_euryale.AAC.1
MGRVAGVQGTGGRGRACVHAWVSARKCVRTNEDESGPSMSAMRACTFVTSHQLLGRSRLRSG